MGDELTQEQKDTLQDPQVEDTHPDALARKQYEADTPDPDSQDGSGNNPTEAQGGVGAKTEDMKLDPSHEEQEETDDEDGA